MATEYEAFVNRLADLRREAADKKLDDGHGGVSQAWADERCESLVEDLLKGLDSVDPPTRESTQDDEAFINAAVRSAQEIAAKSNSGSGKSPASLSVLGGSKSKNKKKKGKKAPSAQSMDELRQAGNIAFKDGHFEKAIMNYTAALDCGGGAELRPALFSNLSVAFLKNKDPEAALSDANSCLEEDPKFVKGYGRKAAALLELKRFDQAEAAAETGLKMQNTNTDLRKYMKQARNSRHIRALSGTWSTIKSGPTGNKLEMSYIFRPDLTMSIDMMGNQVEATYEIDCVSAPYTLRMTYKGNNSVTPVVYIWEISADRKLQLCQHQTGQPIPRDFRGAEAMCFTYKMTDEEQERVDEELPVEERARDYSRAWSALLTNAPAELRPDFSRAKEKAPTAQELAILNERALIWQGEFMRMRKKYGDIVHQYVLDAMDRGELAELKTLLADTVGYQKEQPVKLRSKSWELSEPPVIPQEPKMEEKIVEVVEAKPVVVEAHSNRRPSLNPPTDSIVIDAVQLFRERESQERKAITMQEMAVQKQREEDAALREEMSRNERMAKCFGFLPTCLPKDFLFLM